MDCAFCKILAGTIPSKIVHRDSDVMAIEDINPQAPTHLLVMPVEHFDTLAHLARDRRAGTLVTRLFEVASELGEKYGDDGYRLVVNTGERGGQTVGHLHVHVLAGRSMTWPPG